MWMDISRGMAVLKAAWSFSSTDTPSETTTVAEVGGTDLSGEFLAEAQSYLNMGRHQSAAILAGDALEEALRAAAKSPWVEVDLARINPIGSHTDADPATVVGVLREMRTAGKGVIGMKILGQGDMRNRQDEALKYALSLDVLDAFTIGAESRAEQEDLIRRIGAA